MRNWDVIEILTLRCTFVGNVLDVLVLEVDAVDQDCPTAIVIQYPEYQPVRLSQ
jgi:hypothetical protein